MLKGSIAGSPESRNACAKKPSMVFSSSPCVVFPPEWVERGLIGLAAPLIPDRIFAFGARIRDGAVRKRPCPPLREPGGLARPDRAPTLAARGKDWIKAFRQAECSSHQRTRHHRYSGGAYFPRLCYILPRSGSCRHVEPRHSARTVRVRHRRIVCNGRNIDAGQQ